MFVKEQKYTRLNQHLAECVQFLRHSTDWRYLVLLYNYLRKSREIAKFKSKFLGSKILARVPLKILIDFVMT